MASVLEHGSHDHPLQRMEWSVTNGQASTCRACSQPFESGSGLYGCCRCGYFLHRTCAFLQPSLQGHPAHKEHLLRLSYPSVSSTNVKPCNICGNASSGFSYSCQSCNFIAHTLCVRLPLKLRYPAHDHPLRLSYTPPSKSTHCDVCKLQIHHCCYICSDKKCVFELHPECRKKQLLESHSGRKKGYKRAKAKKMGKRTAVVAKNIILTKAAFAVVALVTGAGELEAHEDNSEIDDADDIDDDVAYCDDDDAADMNAFFDFPDCYGTADDDLQEESISLLEAHMEGMSLGGTSRSL